MSLTLDISVCTTTGMASFVVTEDGNRAKTDLMPDEMNEVKVIAEADSSRIKAFIANIDATFAEKLNTFSDEKLKECILNPTCGI